MNIIKLKSILNEFDQWIKRQEAPFTFTDEFKDSILDDILDIEETTYGNSKISGKFTIGNLYKYGFIQDTAYLNDLEIEEMGNEVVGDNVLKLYDDSKEESVIFVLDGTQGNDFIFKCIF